MFIDGPLRDRGSKVSRRVIETGRFTKQNRKQLKCEKRFQYSLGANRLKPYKKIKLHFKVVPFPFFQFSKNLPWKNECTDREISFYPHSIFKFLCFFMLRLAPLYLVQSDDFTSCLHLQHDHTPRISWNSFLLFFMIFFIKLIFDYLFLFTPIFFLTLNRFFSLLLFCLPPIWKNKHKSPSNQVSGINDH